VLKPLAELVGRRMQIRVAVSEAARQTGLRSGGGDFEVLFNGVEMERFESAPPRRDEEGRPAVLFLGRHEQRKGLNVLLDAFAMLERPAVLWVAGDGPATEVQRRRYPESDRVRWLGLLSDDEVAARLAGATVLCAPSLQGESFGMVLLEGMAAGCAVVASDIEGYRTASGGHATLVPPGDAGALARSLGSALADAVEGVGQSSMEARKAATEHARAWSMDTLAERYLDVYARAIGASRTGP
jgi:phosphatidyl-myo-inositol alpha-mannosyltransferase